MVAAHGLPRPAAHADAHELLAQELDVVLLSVPIGAAHRLGLDVLASGAHLICEKPLGESAAEGAELVRAAEAAGAVLFVGENVRYQPRFAAVAQLVADGAIGAPRAYVATDLQYVGPDGRFSVTPWRQRGDHRGGYLLDGGAHAVAGLRAMVGETPSSVHAVPASLHPEHLGGPWDTALVNLRFRSGVVGHLTLGYGSPDREPGHPRILGTTGTIALKPRTIEIWRADETQDAVLPLADTSDGIAHEWDDVVRALTAGSPPAFSPWEAVADLAVLDAVLESAASGAVVDVHR
jgi:predicted dehydrogenase